MAGERKSYLFGLRGSALEWGLIWTVIFPAYTVFGWNNGIAGSTFSDSYFEAQFPLIDLSGLTGAAELRTSEIEGTVTATYTLGALFGSLACIWVGDPLGRRKTIGLGALISAVGVILETSSFSIAQLIVGRLIEGFGFGMLSATAPNWQTECSTSGHRGAAVILESMFISLGLAIQGWVAFGCNFIESSADWRFPISLSIFWYILIIIALPFVPESPRWLVKHGRVEEAREILSALEDKDPHSDDVNYAMEEIQETVRIAGKGRFVDIFKMGELRLRNRVILACLAGAFQQWCGINALAFYQSTIFETYLGVDGNTSRILAASVFTWQTICSPIGVITVDRLGRRKLMMIAAAGMGVSMLIVASCSIDTSNTASVGAACAGVFLFSLFFPVGFLGLAFLYASEISPLESRTYITSISTATVWLSTFVVTEMTPPILTDIDGRYYYIYGAINLVIIVPIVYLFFPETVGRTLEEVDEIFRNSKNALQPVKFSRNAKKNHVQPQHVGGEKVSIEQSEVKEDVEIAM